MSNEYPADDPHRLTPQERVQLPALFLIVGGVINLAASLVLVTFFVYCLSLPEADLRNEVQAFWDKAPDAARQIYVDQGMNRDNFPAFFRAALPRSAAIHLFTGTFAVLSLVGGLLMRRLKGYSVAVTGSVLMALPCLSPLGCCLMGEAIGIWCIVVLLNGDVRAAFRGPAAPNEQQERDF